MYHGLQFSTWVGLRKKTPTSPGQPAWNAGFEGGKPDLWGSFFAGQSKWKISNHGHVLLAVGFECRLQVSQARGPWDWLIRGWGSGWCSALNKWPQSRIRKDCWEHDGARVGGVHDRLANTRSRWSRVSCDRTSQWRQRNCFAASRWRRLRAWSRPGWHWSSQRCGCGRRLRWWDRLADCCNFCAPT